METVNDVLHNMNKLTFIGKLEDNTYENFDKIRKKLLEYFSGGVDTVRLVILLNIVDNIKITFINCDHGLKTDLLENFRVMYFDLIKEKSVSPEVDDKFMTLEEILENQKSDNYYN